MRGNLPVVSRKPPRSHVNVWQTHPYICDACNYFFFFSFFFSFFFFFFHFRHQEVQFQFQIRHQSQYKSGRKGRESKKKDRDQAVSWSQRSFGVSRHPRERRPEDPRYCEGSEEAARANRVRNRNTGPRPGVTPRASRTRPGLSRQIGDNPRTDDIV